jgi:hypothetical protein
VIVTLLGVGDPPVQLSAVKDKVALTVPDPVFLHAGLNVTFPSAGVSEGEQE